MEYLDKFVEYLKEALRLVGEGVQEDFMDPNPIGDGINEMLSTDDVGKEIEDYMRKNPKATKHQADTVVAYQLGKITTTSYQMAVKLLKDQNKWEK